MLAYGGDFRGVLVPEALEHFGEHVADGIDDLVIVMLEGHLHVEADEFGQMPEIFGIFIERLETFGLERCL